MNLRRLQTRLPVALRQAVYSASCRLAIYYQYIQATCQDLSMPYSCGLPDLF